LTPSPPPLNIPRSPRPEPEKRRSPFLFPLRDDNPTLLTPVVTIVLILANVVVWLYVQGMGFSMEVLGATVCRFGAVPAAVTGQLEGTRLVELAPGLPPCRVGEQPYLGLVTSMFMHGSWLHLIANMWFLWLFGNNIEDSMGHGRFLVFYLLTGVLATLAHIYSAPSSIVPVVGASGAISAVMGAYLVLYPRVRIQTLFIFIIIFRIIPMPAWFVLILWFALQLMAGWSDPLSTTGVAVWAHVGGFVAGVVLVKLFDNPALVAARQRHA
jgi:membrane associated rhomboid family serine protease